MANIIDQILQGVIPYDQNEALQALAKIFGDKLIGVGSTSSRLVDLSAVLNPIYLALLFMILAYIGVSGVVKTASEGKFLGNRWSSFGVPAMFMVCVILLTPVPTQNGSTLGQVIFVKGLKMGSNLADFALMKVFDQAQTEVASYNLASEHIPQVNDQMKGAFVMYICANQITQMGYGSRVNYFLLLKEVCGIPADMVGKFAPFYTLGNTQSVNTINAQISQWSSMTGIQLPPQPQYATTNVTGYVQNMSKVSKQVECHFNQFDNFFRTAVPANIAAATTITPLFPVAPIKGPNGSAAIPQQLNSTLLVYNKPHLTAMWPQALNASYNCIVTPAILGGQDKAKKIYTSNPNTLVPWRAGWSNAALAISDELDTYKSAMDTSKLSLSMEAITPPNVAALGDSLTDKKNQGILQTSLTDLQDYTSGVNSTIDYAGQVLANVIGAANGSAVQDWGRVAANVLIPLGVNKMAAGAGSATAGDMAKLKKASSFLESLVGKASTAVPGAVNKGLGKISSLSAAAFSKLSSLVEMWMKKDKLVDSAGSNPIGMAAKLVNGVVNFLTPGPVTMMIIAAAMIAINVVVLLPQVVLLVVMLIWMTKAAVWFMIIPLATVLIALPETRVGHDIWKSALAIIITPMLALIFYLVSLFISDQMYASVIYWIFQPIISSFGNGIMSGIGTSIMQLLTNEIVFRLLAGIAIICAVTVYMSMLILRGPDIIFGSLGLRGGSGDFGNEFERLREGISPTGSRIQGEARSEYSGRG